MLLLFVYTAYILLDVCRVLRGKKVAVFGSGIGKLVVVVIGKQMQECDILKMRNLSNWVSWRIMCAA